MKDDKKKFKLKTTKKFNMEDEYDKKNVRKPKIFKKEDTRKKSKLGYPELCHNQLDCFCFVLNLVGVDQN